MKLLFTIYCFCLCFNCYSQNPTPTNPEKIKTLLDTYFLEDREIIHVQFNKNLYLNNEDIGFKGYVFSKNYNTPAYNTANIQLVIYNEQQEVVQKQLLFCSNGQFSGGIHLNENFKTGNYLFHFYTNWMNNFKEDDSFSQTIEIHNVNEPFYSNRNEPNLKTATVTFFPEGGNIIDGITNSIGVKITDCNNRGIELNDILILDSKSSEMTRFNTNKMGNGMVNLTADLNEKYVLKIVVNGQTIKQDLPLVQSTGMAVSYNNNLPNNKLAIAVKTNEKGVELYQNKKYDLLIQQNGYSVLKEINFNNKAKEQVLMLDKKYLQNGVNSIRLLDENLDQITERLLYNYATNEIETQIAAKTIAKDSISLSGTTKLKKASISMSVLPEKNNGLAKKRTLLGTYFLNAYIENPETDTFYYFDPENKNRKKDMDVLMLNQTKSKFQWENIKSNPPIISHKFTKGVTIKGTVDGKNKTNISRSVSLISIKNGVFEKIAVEKDNTFRLNNFFVQDSTVYVLQLENEKNGTVFSKIVAQVDDNQTKFNLPIRFNKTNCPVEKNNGEAAIFSSFKLKKNTIELEEVLISKKKKAVFIHNKGTTANTVAHKIDDSEFGTILDFIGRNGFDTGINPSQNTAYIRSRRDAFQEGASPEVYVDDVLLFDFNILFDLDIETADEIYIDKSGIGSTRGNSSGTIKIYLKRGKESPFYISKCVTFIATGGFSKKLDFKNSTFTGKKEFDTFGTLHWAPNTTIKENEIFQMKFPKGNQSVIQVLLEGFSEEGQLISEIKKIPVDNL